MFTPGYALLTMASMIFLMARLDMTLMLLALAIAPVMVGATLLVGGPLRAAAKLKREIEIRLQAHVQQTLSGIPVVQAFAQEDRESQRFERFADTVIQSQKRSAWLRSINSLSSGLITTLGSGVILWVGARHAASGSLGIGGIILFLTYLNQLPNPNEISAGPYTF